MKKYILFLALLGSILISCESENKNYTNPDSFRKIADWYPESRFGEFVHKILPDDFAIWACWVALILGAIVMIFELIVNRKDRSDSDWLTIPLGFILYFYIAVWILTKITKLVIWLFG